MITMTSCINLLMRYFIKCNTFSGLHLTRSSSGIHFPYSVKQKPKGKLGSSEILPYGFFIYICRKKQHKDFIWVRLSPRDFLNEISLYPLMRLYYYISYKLGNWGSKKLIIAANLENRNHPTVLPHSLTFEQLNLIYFYLLSLFLIPIFLRMLIFILLDRFLSYFI